MRLACVLVLLPLPAFAGGDPEALYRLVHGTWAETRAACATENTWVFAEGSLVIHGDGGETCGFDRPVADAGRDMVIDILCPVPGEEMQASARRIGLDLASVSPGLADPRDRLTVADRDRTVTLERCPAGG